MTSDSDVKAILKIYEGMKSARGPWEAHWERVREVSRPGAATFTGVQTPGAESRSRVYDQTAENALDRLAAGLVAALSNPQTQWFGVRTASDAPMRERRVKEWLSTVERVLMAVFHSPRSGFYPAQHEKYLDLAFYGTGIGYIMERPGDIPLYNALPLEQCYLAEDSSDMIDTLYRCWSMPASKARKTFQEDAGPKVLKAANDENRHHEMFEFVHAVYPRYDRDPGKADARNMPWASVFINKTEKHLISVSGYREFPFQCPRWSKRAGEIYGRGAGIKALPDVRMLQRGMKVTIRSHEKSIDPPLQVSDDGVFGKINLTAGAINSVRWDLMRGNEGGAIRPIETGARPDIGEAFLASARERIEEIALTPLFRFARDPNMTATQVLQLTEQSMQQLNPILGRLQQEDLGPIIERSLSVLIREGRVPEPPESLDGQELLFEYVSPTAKAARIGEIRAVSQMIDVLRPMADFEPSVFDSLDPDLIPRRVAEVLSVPVELTRTAEQVEQIRAERAEQAQAAAQAEQMEQLATAAGRAAPAIRELQGGGS